MITKEVCEVVVLSGIPCSGKTTYRKKYLPNHAVVSRDDIRLSLTPSGRYNDWVFSKENEDKVTEEFDNLYWVFLGCRRNIVLDNTYCKQSYIENEIRRLPKHQYYRIRVIFFDCPLWKAYLRNIGRWITTGKYIPLKVMRDMKKNYDKIDKKKYAVVHK